LLEWHGLLGVSGSDPITEQKKHIYSEMQDLYKNPTLQD
jgi:hypothetical protein